MSWPLKPVQSVSSCLVATSTTLWLPPDHENVTEVPATRGQETSVQTTCTYITPSYLHVHYSQLPGATQGSASSMPYAQTIEVVAELLLLVVLVILVLVEASGFTMYWSFLRLRSFSMSSPFSVPPQLLETLTEALMPPLLQWLPTPHTK